MSVVYVVDDVAAAGRALALGLFPAEAGVTVRVLESVPAVYCDAAEAGRWFWPDAPGCLVYSWHPPLWMVAAGLYQPANLVADDS